MAMPALDQKGGGPPSLVFGEAPECVGTRLVRKIIFPSAADVGYVDSAISAGFGMFDVLPLPYLIQFNELFSAPFFEAGNATNLPAGSFPRAAFAVVAGSPKNFRQAYCDPNPRRNDSRRF